MLFFLFELQKLTTESPLCDDRHESEDFTYLRKTLKMKSTELKPDSQESVTFKNKNSKDLSGKVAEQGVSLTERDRREDDQSRANSRRDETRPTDPNSSSSSSKNSTECSDSCTRSSDDDNVSEDSLSPSSIPCSPLVGLKERILARKSVLQEIAISPNLSRVKSVSPDNRIQKNITDGSENKSYQCQQQRKALSTGCDLKNVPRESEQKRRIDSRTKNKVSKSKDFEVAEKNIRKQDFRRDTRGNEKKREIEVKESKTPERTDGGQIFRFENSDNQRTIFNSDGILTQSPPLDSGPVVEYCKSYEIVEIDQIRNSKVVHHVGSKNPDFRDEKINRNRNGTSFGSDRCSFSGIDIVDRTEKNDRTPGKNAIVNASKIYDSSSKYNRRTSPVASVASQKKVKVSEVKKEIEEVPVKTEESTEHFSKSFLRHKDCVIGQYNNPAFLVGENQGSEESKTESHENCTNGVKSNLTDSNYSHQNSKNLQKQKDSKSPLRDSRNNCLTKNDSSRIKANYSENDCENSEGVVKVVENLNWKKKEIVDDESMSYNEMEQRKQIIITWLSNIGVRAANNGTPPTKFKIQGLTPGFLRGRNLSEPFVLDVRNEWHNGVLLCELCAVLRPLVKDENKRVHTYNRMGHKVYSRLVRTGCEISVRSKAQVRAAQRDVMLHFLSYDSCSSDLPASI